VYRGPQTTTLNATWFLFHSANDETAALTIDDTAELQLQQTHVGRMGKPPGPKRSKAKAKYLRVIGLKNALRMRPDPDIRRRDTWPRKSSEHAAGHDTGHDGSMDHRSTPTLARDECGPGLENMFCDGRYSKCRLKAVRSQDFHRL